MITNMQGYLKKFFHIITQLHMWYNYHHDSNLNIIKLLMSMDLN